MAVMEIIYGVLIVSIAIFSIYCYRRKKMLEIYNSDGSLSYDITKNGLRILGIYTSQNLSGNVTIPIKTKANEKVSVIVSASASNENYGSAVVTINSITQTAVNCTITSTAHSMVSGDTMLVGYVRIFVLGSMS